MICWDNHHLRDEDLYAYLSVCNVTREDDNLISDPILAVNLLLSMLCSLATLLCVGSVLPLVCEYGNLRVRNTYIRVMAFNVFILGGNFATCYTLHDNSQKHVHTYNYQSLILLMQFIFDLVVIHDLNKLDRRNSILGTMLNLREPEWTSEKAQLLKQILNDCDGFLDGIDQKSLSELEEQPNFVCTITFGIMRDPVYLVSNNVRCYFERLSIESWLHTSMTHPTTRQPISHRDIWPDPKLKAQIEREVSIARSLCNKSAAEQSPNSTENHKYNLRARPKAPAL